jgi:signal transduction histidine kinase
MHNNGFSIRRVSGCPVAWRPVAGRPVAWRPVAWRPVAEHPSGRPVRRWVLDAFIAVTFTAYSLLLLHFTSTATTFQLTFYVIAMIFAGAFLLVRRNMPIISVIGTFIATMLVDPGEPACTAGAVGIALYSVMVYRSTRLGWVVLICVELGFVAQLTVYRFAHPGQNAFGAATMFAIVALIGGLVGAFIGTRRRYIHSLSERAAQLLRERDQQKELATAAERSRIAREMHDIVSHSLTVMVTLADGSAAQLRTDPHRASAAINHIAETGRHALTDMRRMLGVLNERGAEPERAPMPEMHDLLPLVQRMRAAGLRIIFTFGEHPVTDEAFQLTVYRIVQECLTNVLRHEPNTGGVTVALSQSNDTLTISVHNLPGGTVHEAIGSSGSGLLGMKSRVDLYSGTLTAAPTTDGGWATIATLRIDSGSTSNATVRQL